MYYSEITSFFDWLLLPFYLVIIYFVAAAYKERQMQYNPIYKYFLWGVFAKIFGALALCFVYLFYYKTGGDTLNYHTSARAMVNLLFYNSNGFFDILFGANGRENYSYFTSDTGYPVYWGDYNAFNVVKLITPIELISFKSYFVSSVLMAVISFTGIWKLYVLFCTIFPGLYRQLAFAILFIPSVLFWGSGILKDSWTLAATGWFTYSFYYIVIVRKNILFHSIAILISFFILISVKPYIFVALMPGCLIWGMWNRIVSIRSMFFKILFVPVVLAVGVGGGVFLWGLVSSSLGEYSSIDSMIKRAHVTSEDLKQSYYQGNSFDIGTFEPTMQGVIAKFPIATLTGLFRPGLWETKNIVMVLSGLENTILLLLFINVFFGNFYTSIVTSFTQPLVLFSLLFAIFFAFSVALSTSNFGALVRLRIPLLPFFVAALVIIKYLRFAKIEPAPGPAKR